MNATSVDPRKKTTRPMSKGHSITSYLGINGKPAVTFKGLSGFRLRARFGACLTLPATKWSAPAIKPQRQWSDETKGIWFPTYS
jgi:hypothetical protein